jgi:glycosyltransferase 2 family protein
MLNIRIPLPVKIGASLLLLAVVLAKVDVPALYRTLSGSHPYYLLLATLASFAVWLVNAYKWQVLLSSPGSHLSYRELLRLTFIGIFYNFLVPGQVGGEVVKGVSLARMGVSKMAAAVSVIADRVTGLLALFVLGVVGAALSPAVTGEHPELMPWLVGLALAFGVASVVLVTGRGQAALLAVGRALRMPVGRGQEQVSVQVRGVSSLWLPLVLSFAFQAVVVYINLLLCVALGIQAGYVQLMWVVAVVSLLQSLPISVAGIGVREGAYVYLLQLQGVPAESALALSLTVFAIQVLIAGAGGLWQLSSLLRNKQPVSS